MPKRNLLLTALHYSSALNNQPTTTIKHRKTIIIPLGSVIMSALAASASAPGGGSILFACSRCYSRHPFEELSPGQQLCKVTFTLKQCHLLENDANNCWLAGMSRSVPGGEVYLLPVRVPADQVRSNYFHFVRDLEK
jgi:hypothetical protein